MSLFPSDNQTATRRDEVAIPSRDSHATRAGALKAKYSSDHWRVKICHGWQEDFPQYYEWILIFCHILYINWIKATRSVVFFIRVRIIVFSLIITSNMLKWNVTCSRDLIIENIRNWNNIIWQIGRQTLVSKVNQ